MTLVTPNSGLVTGGTEVLVIDTRVDTSACSDDFASVTLGPLWANISAGGGTVYPDSARGALQLLTTATPGGLAGVRAVSTSTNTDIEITGQIVLSTAQPGGINAPFALSLYIGAGTEFRLDVQVDALGVTVVRARATENSRTLLSQVRTLSTAEATGLIRLRLVRFGARVLGLFNGTVIVDALWRTTAASPTIEARNDAAIASRVVGRIFNYERRVLVAFGAVPAIEAVLRLDDRVVVNAPATEVPGPDDVTVVGCGGQTVVVDGFTYELGGRFDIRSGNDALLTVLDDPTLRNT